MGVPRTPLPQAPSRFDTEAAEVDEGSPELVEVPAAVVCAACGLPECSCQIDRPSAFSGVVAIVPWERPAGSMFFRLWATAKLCTLSPSTFFAALPAGGVLAPLGFALLSELFAALGLFLTLGLVAVLALPAFAQHLAEDAALRGTVLRAAAIAVPALAALMVLLHAAHGSALDAAARREGSEHVGRGLRFGLYACGWDLVTLPLGLSVLTLTDGPLSALRYSARGLTAPHAAALAFLTHVHQFEPEAAARAARRAVSQVFVPLLALIVVGFALGLWSLSR